METTYNKTNISQLDQLFDETIEESLGAGSGQIVFVSELLTTSAGQRFKIVVHQLVWYTVKLFIEVSPRLAWPSTMSSKPSPQQQQLFDPIASLPRIKEIDVSEHTTLARAKHKLAALERDITHANRAPEFDKHIHPDLNQLFFVKIRRGRRVRADPDAYLEPGDCVQVNRNGAWHSGIYAGKRKIITVSRSLSHASDGDDDDEMEYDDFYDGDDDGDDCAVVEEIDWDEFHGGETRLFVCNCVLKYRTNEEIAREAKSRLGRYRARYDYLSKTFASLCQFGGFEYFLPTSNY